MNGVMKDINMRYTGSTEQEKTGIPHLHSDDKINFSEIKEGSILFKLAKKLSVSGSYSVDYKKESIMDYEKVCSHDDGYLCEHRLQFIIDFINKNKEKI